MIAELYGLLHTLMTLYIWVIIIASLLSFVQPDPNNPIVQALYKLTEPTLSFVRQKMPFVMMGGIDLSPLVVIFGLQFIDIIIRNLFFV
jgi:YggT family protein